MMHGLIQHGRELAPSTHEKTEAEDASIPLVLRTAEERRERLFQVWTGFWRLLLLDGDDGGKASE
jgi:hypothetical protein